MTITLKNNELSNNISPSLPRDLRQLKAEEIKACKNGLTCHTSNLVTHKLKKLADFNKSKIPEKPSKKEKK